MGRRFSPPPRNRKAITLGAIGAILAAGVAIKPAAAVYRWNVGPLADGPSSPANALAAAKSYHRRLAPFFLDALVLSYEVENKGKWDPNATLGCNDSWTVSHRSLFGVEVSRAAYLCDGFTSKWL